MEKDKLSQKALSESMKYDPDNEFYNQDFYQGFMSGAEWLQSQPLADRLTEEEREKLTPANRYILASIFGKEMFEKK